MKDGLIQFLVEMFFNREKDKQDPYLMVKFSIPLNALYKLYINLIQVDVPPIETLSGEEKTKYWNMAKKYYDDKESAIKASKSIYLLNLICNCN